MSESDHQIPPSEEQAHEEARREAIAAAVYWRTLVEHEVAQGEASWLTKWWLEREFEDDADDY